MEQKHEVPNPDVNQDDTFSIKRKLEIPKSDIQSGDEIKVVIEHKSMGTPVIKEITANKPGKKPWECLQHSISKSEKAYSLKHPVDESDDQKPSEKTSETEDGQKSPAES
ncbi:uncharacterized protein LOC102351921 [Latimeria chalumnae]|uniref:uncharacterized protein LOC102351921 n=1 Tax=Latimeria chalumnae TaxID=7897 RepID=UPI00313DFBE1